METYLGLEEFQYMGSKTIDLASAVLHKTITTPQQYFQAEASRPCAAMVAGGTEYLPGASPTPPCGFPVPEQQQKGVGAGIPTAGRIDKEIIEIKIKITRETSTMHLVRAAS